MKNNILSDLHLVITSLENENKLHLSSKLNDVFMKVSKINNIDRSNYRQALVSPEENLAKLSSLVIEFGEILEKVQQLYTLGYEEMQYARNSYEIEDAQRYFSGARKEKDTLDYLVSKMHSIVNQTGQVDQPSNDSNMPNDKEDAKPKRPKYVF
jgi:hypothetical protein